MNGIMFLQVKRIMEDGRSLEMAVKASLIDCILDNGEGRCILVAKGDSITVDHTYNEVIELLQLKSKPLQSTQENTTTDNH